MGTSHPPVCRLVLILKALQWRLYPFLHSTLSYEQKYPESLVRHERSGRHHRVGLKEDSHGLLHSDFFFTIHSLSYDEPVQEVFNQNDSFDHGIRGWDGG
jgi:hypothetical protein